MNEKTAIVCDFDGTITVRDVGHHFFGKFVRDRALWEDTLEKWKIGLISSRECLLKELELIDAGREDLDRFIEKESFDPYFKDFIDFCDRNDFEFVILSDGLDYYIDSMLMDRGFGYLDYRANHVVFDEGKISNIEFPYFNTCDCTLCGNCKKFHLDQLKKKGYKTVYIGNGYSDRCPAEHADIIFAKDDLLSHCRQKKLDHVKFSNFRDVERELTSHLYRE
ncbi:MAG: MtnX-like HAD-IB family phosphatase [Candidatus Krumholzibacteriota bacterium]|nr:MtnX-like HAD-IB family phosphatase [Candidatus Krumholzibacteriota bacterium]